MVAQTPTTLAIRPIVTSKHFEICRHSLLLFALLRTFRVSDSQLIIVDAKYRSTFFCGRYGYSFWPIWSFRVADVVVADIWSVTDVVQTRTLIISRNWSQSAYSTSKCQRR